MALDAAKWCLKVRKIGRGALATKPRLLVFGDAGVHFDTYCCGGDTARNWGHFFIVLKAYPVWQIVRVNQTRFGLFVPSTATLCILIASTSAHGASASVDAPASVDELFVYTIDADETPSTDTPYIIGGDPVSTCAWPAAVFVDMGTSLCTGSLVHPEVVITAGHCFSEGIKRVGFGESANSISKFVGVEECVAHPDWDGTLAKGVDFAYCKLSSPVNDVEIIPVLMGCELEYLQPGASVVGVGFGLTSVGGSAGKKYAVETEFQRFTGSEALVGLDSKGFCNGDSGGPVYVNLPEEDFGADAGWRVFGVTSYGDETCPGPGVFGVMSNFVEFVEDDSGIDITPCHDANGVWNPGANCKGAPQDPGAGSGSWPSCSSGPTGGEILSCVADADDVTPPEVEVTFPIDGTVVPIGSNVQVKLKASDADTAIIRVHLRMNDGDLDVDDTPPYAWTIRDVKEGTLEFVGVALDRAGNEGLSETIKVIVSDDEDPMTGGTDGTQSGTSDTGDETTDDGSTGDDESSTDDTTTDDETPTDGDDDESTTNSEDEEDPTPSESDDKSADLDASEGSKGCSLAPRSTPWASLLSVLFAFGVMRRRHRNLSPARSK